MSTFNAGDVDYIAKLNALTADGQEAIIAPTLLNSWVNSGGANEVAGYWKDAHGVVHIRGIVASGTIGQAIFTLPVGYRPKATQYFPSVSNAAFAYLSINSSGTVMPVVGNNAGFNLSGVTFRAE